MTIKYKQVKEFAPHCGDCGERLLGNGSDIWPYQCKCGKWEKIWNWDEVSISYKLKLKNVKNTKK